MDDFVQILERLMVALGTLSSLGFLGWLTWRLKPRPEQRRDLAEAASAEAQAVRANLDGEQIRPQIIQSVTSFYQQQLDAVAEDAREMGKALREEIAQLRGELETVRRQAIERDRTWRGLVWAFIRAIRDEELEIAERIFARMEYDQAAVEQLNVDLPRRRGTSVPRKGAEA